MRRYFFCSSIYALRLFVSKLIANFSFSFEDKLCSMQRIVVFYFAHRSVLRLKELIKIFPQMETYLKHECVARRIKNDKVFVHNKNIYVLCVKGFFVQKNYSVLHVKGFCAQKKIFLSYMSQVFVQKKYFCLTCQRFLCTKNILLLRVKGWQICRPQNSTKVAIPWDEKRKNLILKCFPMFLNEVQF